jgi:hypothetical protein
VFDGKFLGGAIGSAGGYVCGARAGRERYGQMVGPAKRTIGEKIEKVTAKGGQLLEAAREKAGLGGGGTKGAGNSPAFSRDRAIMGQHRNGRLAATLGWLATAVMTVAAIAYFATLHH